MRAAVFWVADVPHGRLAILPRPRGGEWLPDEAEAWREAGLGMVISLLEADEAAQLGREREAEVAQSCGVTFRAFPIPDRGVPTSLESVAELTGKIVLELERGHSVAVHCRQGVGRSGLLGAAVLVAMGRKPAAALEAVADARGMEVPETPEQRRWLDNFAAWLASVAAAHPRHAADGAA
jgi:protein-tyrosine phosphatase